MADWKSARRSELDRDREIYEEAKRIVESEEFVKAQNAFFVDMLNIIKSWTLSHDDAVRVVSILSYLAGKLTEPFDIIEAYEKKRKLVNDMDSGPSN